MHTFFPQRSVLLIGGEPGVAPPGTTAPTGTTTSTTTSGSSGSSTTGAPTTSAWNFVPLLKLDKMLWWTVGIQKMGLVDPTTGAATLDLCPSHTATAQGGQIPYSCGAVVDTGTSMLGVPYGLWGNFYAQLQAHAKAQKCRIPQESSLQAGGGNVMLKGWCTPAQYPTLRFELPSDVPPASPDEPYSAPPVVFALHPDSYVREGITEWSPGVRRLSVPTVSVPIGIDSFTCTFKSRSILPACTRVLVLTGGVCVYTQFSPVHVTFRRA